MTESLSSSQSDANTGARRFRPDWVNLITIASVHLIAVYAIVYMATVHFSWWTLGLGVVWFLACGLSITAGYHRLFSHRAFEGNALVRLFFVLFGAASVQNSALKWCSDHRRHHSHCDTDADPYNINRGFWWAHIGWVVAASEPEFNIRRRDLEADPIVRFQSRYLVPLTLLMGLVIPALLGMIWGDPVGAVLVAGFLRLVVQWHVTFAINSWAHTVGFQTYGTKTTARDSIILAIFSLGEGYHSFHHTFPTDYRNGIRWYHVDPTKWLIWSLARARMASGLRRTTMNRILSARTEAGRRASSMRDAALAGVDAAKAKVDAAATSGLLAAASPRAAGVPRSSERKREKN